MSNALKTQLRAVDGSQDAIEGTASAMMKLYATPEVAVTAWRDAVHQSCTARDASRALALLYVANEVMQISKRNRGAAFVRAFGDGVGLGPALQAICQIDPARLTEKVRRTVKIWGERRIFSTRFVAELLKGLEAYRTTTTTTTTTSSTTTTTAATTASSKPVVAQSRSSETSKNNNKASGQKDDNDDDDDDDIMKLLEQDNSGGSDNNDPNDDDDDDDVFASGESKLQINLDLDKMARTGKRRRSSMGSTGSQNKKQATGNARRKRNVLSITNLHETLKKLATLQDDAQIARDKLEAIDKALAATTAEELEQLVGTALQQSFDQTQKWLQDIQEQRAALYQNAQETHQMEQQLLAYLPWLETSLTLDKDDVALCDTLRTQLVAWQPWHGRMRQARDEQRQQAEQARQAAAQAAQRQKEAEETAQFRAAALNRQTERRSDSQHMMWNPATREYQEMNLDETWRDH